METGEAQAVRVARISRIGRIWYRLLDSFSPLTSSYFSELGLSKEEIKGKRILDLGAGQAGFADVYHGWKGTKIYSLDKAIGLFGTRKVPKDIPYIQANIKEVCLLRIIVLTW